jgi:hypothetical protein
MRRASVIAVVIAGILWSVPAGASASHTWAVRHQGQLRTMVNDLDSASGALGALVKKPGAQTYANVEAACSTLGAETLRAADWTVPRGVARNDMVGFVLDTTQLVHDCLSVNDLSSQSQVGTFLTNIARDEAAVEKSFKAFTKALS